MRLPQQPYTLRSVLIDTFPVYIAKSEVVLSSGISLFSHEPLCGEQCHTTAVDSTDR